MVHSVTLSQGQGVAPESAGSAEQKLTDFHQTNGSLDLGATDVCQRVSGNIG